MDSNSYQSPLERKKQLRAWKEVWSRYYIAGFVCVGCAAYIFTDWLDQTDYIAVAVYALLCIFAAAVAGCGLWICKENVYRELFGNNWKENKGIKPACTTVNIERQNGEIQWKVGVDDFDWSLDQENPIISYLQK